MLSLKGITKIYETADEKLTALDNIELNFGGSEFVSILGPSGCGKTTLLNIIGGLDRYTSGDMCINGISTEGFTDREWDSYRNHSIGFVFQNYNLIPHLNVLDNVELALTLVGEDKETRRGKALKALEEVGLRNKAFKKPNQLSGGQMQRVAIARALINDPDIILADEPTGALDSETSVLVMDTLKKISKTKLVIMVTHNAELAKAYSTRIIRLFDGKVVGDTAPYVDKNDVLEGKGKQVRKGNKKIKGSDKSDKYEKKPAMSFLSAAQHSFKNLAAKKFRTILTAIASSIGILGIGLVLALYSGLNAFVDRQESSLASYPITITKGTVQDTEAVINTVVSALDGLDGKYEKDKVYIYKLVQQLIKNKNNYNNFDEKMLADIKSVNSNLYYDIYENYNLNFNVVKNIPSGTKLLGKITTVGNIYFAINTTGALGWAQLPSRELVEQQYELIAGSYPKNEKEIVLILDAKNQISDLNLFFNGLNMESVTLDYSGGEDVAGLTMNVSDFLGVNYRLVKNDYYYNSVDPSKNPVKKETASPNGTINLINQIISEQAGSGYTMWFFEGDERNATSYVYNKLEANSYTLSISGVIKLKDDVSMGVLGSSAIGYTSGLTELVLSEAEKSSLVKNYLATNPDTSSSAVTNKLKGYGYSTLPERISIYCKNFESKAALKAELTEISNERKAAGETEIVYSDVMSILLNIVQQFINIITIVLLSLTAVSLVVSLLMIGIITYVSVLERTKEIGVLRALGARKKDISGIFNVETVIIGFVSGVIGVVLAYIGSIPLSAIIAKYTGITGLVVLPWYLALALVVLSALLTFVAGLVPSNIAKRKDPVKALRSE